MQKISYDGYRFLPEIIRQAIWPYLSFNLSLRDVEDLLAERGIIVSYKTVRRWVNRFGTEEFIERTVGPTTALRVLISRRVEENARCSASKARDRRSDFFPHAAVYNTFNVQRHLTSRPTHRKLRFDAMNPWREAAAAA
jgi:hypothetical protein